MATICRLEVCSNYPFGVCNLVTTHTDFAVNAHLSLYFLVSSCNSSFWYHAKVFSGVFQSIFWCVAKVFSVELQKYLRCSSSLATTLRRRLPISCLLALSSTTPHICIHYPAKEAFVLLLAHSSTVSKYEAH